MNLLRAAIFAALCSPLVPATAQADWTRFRGPNGNGVVDGKFASALTEKNIAWSIDLPGQSHASPVIWKERLYLTSSNVEEGKRYVSCHSAKDGKLIWQKEFKFEKFKQHADNSYSSATPAVDDVGVYIAWSSPQKYELIALSHDGKELWKQNLGGFKSVQGGGTSPIVVDDNVIIANDQEGPKSGLLAFEHKSGAMQWKIERKSSDKTAMSTPVVFQPKGGPQQVIFTSKSAGITSVDPKTGQVIWEAPKIFDARTVGSPIATDELVFGACGEGGAHRLLVALRPTAPNEEPTVAFRIERVAPYVPTPLVKGDRLYMWSDVGQISCVSTTTGQELWNGKVGGLYYGSPICVGDVLWCVSRKGDLVGVKAGEKFEEVSKISLGEASHATPAVNDGKMYVRTVSKLFCLDVAEKK